MAWKRRDGWIVATGSPVSRAMVEWSRERFIWCSFLRRKYKNVRPPTWRTGLEEPVLFEPERFRRESCGAAIEGAKTRSTNRRKVNEPATVVAGFDMAGPPDGERAESRKIEFLAVDAPRRPLWVDDELHHALSSADAERTILRRGRSTIQPSSDA